MCGRQLTSCLGFAFGRVLGASPWVLVVGVLCHFGRSLLWCLDWDLGCRRNRVPSSQLAWLPGAGPSQLSQLRTRLGAPRPVLPIPSPLPENGVRQGPHSSWRTRFLTPPRGPACGELALAVSSLAAGRWPLAARCLRMTAETAQALHPAGSPGLPSEGYIGAGSGPWLLRAGRPCSPRCWVGGLGWGVPWLCGGWTQSSLLLVQAGQT